VSDRRVVKLLRQWLKAGVMEEGEVRTTILGTPQGGVISPLLANVYLHELDRIWEQRCKRWGELVRYADDLIIVCSNEGKAKESHRRLKLCDGEAARTGIEREEDPGGGFSQARV